VSELPEFNIHSTHKSFQAISRSSTDNQSHDNQQKINTKIAQRQTNLAVITVSDY